MFTTVTQPIFRLFLLVADSSSAHGGPAWQRANCG